MPAQSLRARMTSRWHARYMHATSECETSMYTRPSSRRVYMLVLLKGYAIIRKAGLISICTTLIQGRLINMSEHILVCVAWPYAKSSTHVGQIVGAYLPADTFARYHRLRGNHVLMVSGSDEHGTPILVDSEREGITPREFVARYHHQICEVWDRLGMSWDLYTETGTENHYRITQDFFLTLYDKGYIFKDTMQSPFCPTDRRFLPDRYTEGTCPICGYSSARGDQCDNCGH